MDRINRISERIHGGNRYEIAEKYGFKLNEIADLSANINFLGPSPEALKAITENPEEMAYYPDSQNSELKELLSKYLEVEANNLLLGNGSVELIFNVAQFFRPLVVLTHIPTFCEYALAAEAVEGNVVEVELDSKRNFELRLEHFLSYLPSVEMVFICNPNNPTGNLFPLNILLEIVEEATAFNTIVVVDEVFIDFVEDHKKFSLKKEATKRKNLIVLGSLTKFFSLAGLRIGYLVAAKDLVERLALAKNPWSVNRFAQVAAAAALKDKGFFQKSKVELIKNRTQLEIALDEIEGLRIYPSRTNFILVQLRRLGSSAASLKEGLAKKGILIRDCSSFKGLNNQFIRIAVGSDETNKKLIQGLKELLE